MGVARSRGGDTTEDGSDQSTSMKCEKTLTCVFPDAGGPVISRSSPVMTPPSSKASSLQWLHTKPGSHERVSLYTHLLLPFEESIGSQGV